jgi:hypothetical protein
LHGKTELSCKNRIYVCAPVPDEKKRQLDEVAINCIIIDSRPWGDFKRSGMLKFLNIAVPGYTGPSSRTVQRNLSKLYKKKREDFQSELSEISNLSITADLWKSKSSRHFLCITTHSMSDTFISNSKVLIFKKFNGRHCAKSIRAHMEKVITQFGLLGKITSTTTDNGSNIRLATTKMRLFGIRIHCLAHALNLTIHNGLRLWEKKKDVAAENETVEENMYVVL